jgi:hypothetical protein
VFHITHELAKKDLEQNEDENAKPKHHQEEEKRLNKNPKQNGR